jgi:hypothetical protein
MIVPRRVRIFIAIVVIKELNRLISIAITQTGYQKIP